ncbi:hypothetical protein Tco_1129521 [Tanacetum coccineum]
MQSSSSDSLNDVLKSIFWSLRGLTMGSQEGIFSNVKLSLKTIAGNSVSTDLRSRRSKILHSIKGTILEEEIFSEFDKFIAIAVNENYDSKSDEEEPKFEKITINTDYKIKTSLEEPPTDLELKPLPDNLEHVFLEEPSFLSVITLSQISA